MSVSEAPALLWERDVVRCNYQVAVPDDFGRAPTLVRFVHETLPQQGGRLAFRWKSAL